MNKVYNDQAKHKMIKFFYVKEARLGSKKGNTILKYFNDLLC